MKLKNEIQAIAIDFPGYEYRRITIELHRRGFEANHKVVYELMKIDNLLCIKKQFVPKTTDITYVRLVREFVYLAVIIDVFSRKCIGWKLGRDIDAKLALAALDMALEDRKDMGISNLIHHSDQGVQYASWEYIDRLKENEKSEEVLSRIVS